MLAGIGAVVGGLLGGGNNTVRGAALGASLGALACVADDVGNVIWRVAPAR